MPTVNPDFSSLLKGALKLLSVRPHSRQEIIVYLHRKTADELLISQVVAKLDHAKFLSDTDFARWLIESRSRFRPRGRRLLAAELQSKGIDPEVISDLLAATDEPVLAATALAKKLRLWQHLSYRDFHTKAARFLASRGFSWEVIEKTVKNGYNESHVT